MRLLTKIVLITGATSGIGKACVEACLKEGAKVIFTGRNLEKIRNLQEQWGSQSIGIVSDASSITDQNQLIETIKKYTNCLDAIYFNAGDVTHAPLEN